MNNQSKSAVSHLLSATQLQAFEQDGFLIVRDYFRREDLQAVADGFAGVVDDVANRLKRAGRLRETYASEPFSRRLTLIEKEFPGASVLVHINGVLPPALAKLWSQPRILDLVGQLLGPEIAGNPVWNIRAKTPLNPLATVPWHQDTAYLADGCEKTFMPTAWIPLVEADERNGTLQVVRCGHRSGVLRHRLEREVGDKRSWYLRIDESDLPPGERVVCSMSPGSFLLINQLTPHRSTENFSDQIRWSVDLRWQRPGEISGQEGIKDPILLRTSRDPSYQPKWDEWARQDRVKAGRKDQPVDEFDTTSINGPWMDRWR
jgi:hypothetical protein